MKTFDSTVLLDNLSGDVRQILLTAEKLKSVGKDLLTAQPGPASWSVAEVLEHLNFYSAFYLKAIEDRLHMHDTEPRKQFRSGWFGNYFTNLMKPGEGNKIKKMKAMKSASPPPTVDAQQVLEKFISDQHQLLNLLEIARSADIGKIRVPTSITKVIALKLGDTFRFLIAHEQRHMVQVHKTLKQLRPAAIEVLR